MTAESRELVVGTASPSTCGPRLGVDMMPSEVAASCFVTDRCRVGCAGRSCIARRPGERLSSRVLRCGAPFPTLRPFQPDAPHRAKIGWCPMARPCAAAWFLRCFMRVDNPRYFPAGFFF